MIQWISGLLHALPTWYWVLLFAGTTYAGLHLISGVISGKVETQKAGDVTLPGYFLLVIAAIASAMMAYGHRADIPFSRWVGFQMMGIGTAAFAARSFLGFLFSSPHKESQKKARGEQTIKVTPAGILVLCRTYLEQAVQERSRLGDSEAHYFLQRGEQHLQFLTDLFTLVGCIDEWFADRGEARQRADAIYPDIDFSEATPLLKLEAVEAINLGKLRACAKRLIEETYYVFSRLSAGVQKEMAYDQADAMEGLRMATRDVLPSLEESSTTGILAELETGRLLERMQDQLAAAGRTVPTGPHSTEAPMTPSMTPQQRRVRA